MKVVAVDIGGTGTKLGVIDGAGLVEHFRQFATEKPLSDYIEKLVQEIIQLRNAAPDAKAVGISVAGFIDREHATMTYNANIEWLEDFPLRDEIGRRSGLPVNLEVDSNAAALGEYHFGAGMGCRRLLCLTIGTGIGAGLVLDGVLARVTHECVGDAGHIIVAPGDERCSCGGYGCAEALASAPAIMKRAHSTAHSFADLARDPASERFFKEAGRHLGVLCASLSSLFFPDRITLGGGVPDASESLVEAARETWYRYSAGAVRRNCTLSKAGLGSKASLVGAACPLLKN